MSLKKRISLSQGEGSSHNRGRKIGGGGGKNLQKGEKRSLSESQVAIKRNSLSAKKKLFKGQ